MEAIGTRMRRGNPFRLLARQCSHPLHFGVRGVIGMVFDFTTIPLDAFVEFAGVLDYRIGSDDERHQGFAFDINAGAGARYYF